MSHPEEYAKFTATEKIIIADLSEAHSLRLKPGTCLALLGFHPFR